MPFKDIYCDRYVWKISKTTTIIIIIITTTTTKTATGITTTKQN